jgi:hypothetical protein
MDGTGSAGTTPATFAMSDHRHPTDTSRQATITGAAVTIDTEKLPVSMAMVSDSSGDVSTHANVTATEIGYLDGVTSAIQTQLNGKAPTSHASTGSSYGYSTDTSAGHCRMSTVVPSADSGTGSAGTVAAIPLAANADHVHPLSTAYAAAVHTHVAANVTDFTTAAVTAVSGSYVPITAGALTANLLAGGFRVKNLAVAVDSADAVTLSQMQSYGINDEVTDWVTLSTSVANQTQLLQLNDSASTTLSSQKFTGIWEVDYSFQNTTNIGRIQFAITSDGGANPALRILGDAPDLNTVQIGIKYVSAGNMSIAFFTDTAVGVGNTTWKIRRLFGLNVAAFVLTGTKITSTLLASGYDTSLPYGGTVVKDTNSTSSTLKVKKTDAHTVMFFGAVQNPIAPTYPTTQGTIPVGYRPSATRYVIGVFSGMAAATILLKISTAGVITKVDDTTFAYSTYLDGVSYSL